MTCCIGVRYRAVMPMTSLVLAFAIWGAQTPTPLLDDLAWMAGCWELTRNGRHVIEQWMLAEGGTMLATPWPQWS